MNKINIGLIGCGGFAKAAYLPLLKMNSTFSVRATADIDEARAKDFAAETGASYWTTEVDGLLSDDKIDAVFITTRHDLHAPLTIKAASAGKHILCEKPMGLKADECRDIAIAVKKHNVKYTVGYNRGMAPVIMKACNLLEGISEKKMIYHRIQAHFPAEHWTHEPNVGGGRFVGEGCHIFDLLCKIVQKPPVKVYASGGTFLDPERVKIPDSAVVTITFSDGSVGTTLVSSAGCDAFPKEATEIYCDKKAIYINDFKKMEYYGFERQDKVSTEYSNVDKGHANELEQFADAILNGSPSPNGLAEAARAAIISYKVNESIARGMPVAIDESEYIF